VSRNGRSASSGRVGIVCALPEELHRLGERMDGPEDVDLGPMSGHAGALDGHEVVLVRAGMGKVNTAMTAAVLVSLAGARALMFSGVAGGLDPALGIGDVVVADRCISHDAGVLADAGLRSYQAGHLPFVNPTDELGYRVPAQLLERARAHVSGIGLPPLSRAAGGSGRPARIAFGTILSGDQYVASADARDRLFTAHTGLAVEMEGAALAQVAEAMSVPWLVVRALSDLAGGDAEIDFASFAAEVAASSASVVRALLPALADEAAARAQPQVGQGEDPAWA